MMSIYFWSNKKLANAVSWVSEIEIQTPMVLKQDKDQNQCGRHICTIFHPQNHTVVYFYSHLATGIDVA